MARSCRCLLRDYIPIGSTPAGEDCAQVGTDNYAALARKECRAFIGQIIRALGSPPAGARLFIKSNPHDFGTYYEVACEYERRDDEEEEENESENYAFRCESDAPETWDNIARAELKQ